MAGCLFFQREDRHDQFLPFATRQRFDVLEKFHRAHLDEVNPALRDGKRKQGAAISPSLIPTSASHHTTRHSVFPLHPRNIDTCPLTRFNFSP